MKKFLALFLLLIPFMSWGAISFDVAGSARTTTTTTLSLTATNTGSIALIYVWLGSGGTMTSMTVDGNNATAINNITEAGTGQKIFAYCYDSPPTSAVNYTAVSSVTNTLQVIIYEGVDETCAELYDTTDAGTPTADFNLNVLVADSWISYGGRGVGTGSSAPTGGTERNDANGAQSGDKSGFATGSQTLQVVEDDVGSAFFGSAILLSPVVTEESTSTASTTTVEIDLDGVYLMGGIFLFMFSFSFVVWYFKPIKT